MGRAVETRSRRLDAGRDEEVRSAGRRRRAHSRERREAGFAQRRATASIALLVGATVLTGCGAGSQAFGHFEGEVKTEWLGNGRQMKLLADFAYEDPQSGRWPAAKDSVVDGASIPQVFWSFIGGPFEGEYRNASVVHDVACQQKSRDWRDVHRMFYDACRCGGVCALKAKLLYAAVYHFGPRWGADAASAPPWTSDEDFERLLLTVASEPDLPVDDIERLSPEVVRQRVPTLPERVPARELALPLLRKSLSKHSGSAVRPANGGDALVLEVPQAVDDAAAETEVRHLETLTRDGIDRQAARIESDLESTRDKAKRKSLATQLLQLGRQRAALRQVGPVRIERAPPR